MAEKCTWTQTIDGAWDTSCSHAFEVNNGTPFENHMAFCCYCGKTLEEVPYRDEDDD